MAGRLRARLTRRGVAARLAGVAAVVLPAMVLSSCTPQAGPTPTETLEQYVMAANRHDVTAVRDMTAEDAVWVLGRDTLRGRDEMTGPIAYDKGANTKLTLDGVTSLRGDTIEFRLTEKNDVLASFGVPEMHHAVRMVIHDGTIHEIVPLAPAPEGRAVADSMAAMMAWLREHRPEDHARLWKDGRFNYALETGEQMPNLIRAWRRGRR